MTSSVLRDFLYLDQERLRSYTAQLLGGVPESSERVRDHEMGVTGGAEAGLFGFLKASGEADYRYRRSATETSSLHHQVYGRFEDALARGGLLETIDSQFDYDEQWTPDRFADGAFVRISGRVQLVDYAATLRALETFPKLYKSFNTVQMSNIATQLESELLDEEGAKAQRRELNEGAAAIKKLPISAMVEVARNLYGEGQVRVKVAPDGAPSEVVVVGTGLMENMLRPLAGEGLIQSPDATSWVAVGQLSAAVESTAFSPIPTGNALEDAVEGMSASFRSLVKMGNAAVFPVFEFLPLAVYR